MQLLLGAYLLGGLSAGEAAAVRAHLDSCAPCKAEHDYLACVPAWLSLLPAKQVPTGPAVTGALDERGNPGEQEDPLATA